MKYKAMSKEKIDECPVFRKSCMEHACGGFELQKVQKPKTKKSKAGEEEFVEEEIKYCTYLNLFIK